MTGDGKAGDGKAWKTKNPPADRENCLELKYPPKITHIPPQSNPDLTTRVEPHPQMKRKRRSRPKRSRRKMGRRRKRLRQLRQKRLREMKQKRQNQQKQKLRWQILQRPQKLPSSTVPVSMLLLPNQQLMLTRKRRLHQRQLNQRQLQR
jgi:hypothetical protein